MNKNGSEALVKVLLVDDKPANLFSLQQLLESENDPIDFVKASSGQEALKMAFYEDIALILLDVQMPDMDGYEVAKILKQNKKTSSIPIIFVTALNQEAGYVLEGFEKGAVDYLFKPLDPSIARAKVRAFINIFLQQRELAKKNILLQNLGMLVNNAVDLMCILNSNDLAFQTINPAWENQLGYQEEEVKSKNFLEFFDSSREHIETVFSEAINQKQETVSFEARLKHNNGEQRWISWSMVWQNEKWYGNGKDITKRKLQEENIEKINELLEEKVRERTQDLLSVNEKLQKTNAHLDTIVYTASHDLKMPINNLHGLLALLQKQLPVEDERTGKVLEMCNQSVDKLKETILGLISLIKQDDEGLLLEDLICHDVVEDIKLSIQDIIKTNNANIICDFEACPAIRLTKPGLKSVLYNLISNAIKYRSPDRSPLVHVKSEMDGPFVRLTVKDNGLGMDEEGKKNIFSRFKRLHNHVEGTGMGLYIVKKTIEQVGGKVEVESELGQGSEFRIYVPHGMEV